MEPRKDDYEGLFCSFPRRSKVALGNSRTSHLVGLGEQEEPSEFNGPSDQPLDESSGQQLLHVGREVELGKLTETEVTSFRNVALNDNRRDPLDLGQCRLYDFTAARVRKEIVQSKARTRTVLGSRTTSA